MEYRWRVYESDARWRKRRRTLDNAVRINRQEELQKTYSKYKEELNKFHQRVDEIARKLGWKDGASLATLVTANGYRQETLRTAIHDQAILREEMQFAQSYLKKAKSRMKSTALMAVAGAFCGPALPPEDAGQQIVPREFIEDALKRDAELQEQEAEVLKAEKLLRDTEARYTDPASSENVMDKKKALKAAELKRDKYRAEAWVRHEKLLKVNLGQNDELRLATLEAEYDRIKSRYDRADTKIADLQKEIAKSDLYSGELENIKLEIAQKEKAVAAMGDEIERLKIEGKVPQRVTILEEPFIVTGIEGNRRMKYAFLSSLGVLVLGIGGIVGWEARHRRVMHIDDVSRELGGTRLIGTMPPLTPTVGEAEGAHEHLHLVEAIDTARTMLMHGSPDARKLRVLMVTSAISGEGKTTLAGHLAISLTRAGFRTLLVDGDMQAPSAHLLFDLPSTPGLSELLRGEASLRSVVRPSPIPGLSILPAGQWTMATRQMLVGEKWGQLKRVLESQFDFVVIDTSPLLLVTDTILMAREADGVILSVLVGVSQLPCISQTVQRLNAVGAELVGVVVNNVPNHVYRKKASYQSTARPRIKSELFSKNESREWEEYVGATAIATPGEELIYAEELPDEKESAEDKIGDLERRY
jgi:succinoglycan biosynthesis transport protein ExoP